MVNLKKPDTKGYILCDSIYITFWKRQNDWDRNPVSNSWELRGGIDYPGHQEILGGRVSVLCLDHDDDNTIVYAGKTHLTVPLKGSEFYYT